MTVSTSSNIPSNITSDANSFDAKVWRCAKVTIKFSSEDLMSYHLNKEGEWVEDNINHFDNEINRDLDSIIEYVNQTDDFASVLENDTFNRESIKEMKNMTETQKAAVLSDLESKASKADAEQLAALYDKTNNAVMVDNSDGTENEYMYFRDLQENDSFLHSKIVEKIQYFDPAFHSITPEGFNSRLTFLHQCTRQGSTYSLSDRGMKTASNLAFGMPPICILRIGDFYNTRVLIDSLSINYDNATWDLNDEGIGVMPMIADVSINFKFLGGSDLTGPIKRLQNAVSFNYYANTSVYNGRADKA